MTWVTEVFGRNKVAIGMVHLPALPGSPLHDRDGGMDLGESLGTIRKVAKVKKNMVAPDAIVGVVERLHRAYNFRPEVYRFVGIGEEVLREAGVLGEGGKRATPKRPRP